MRALAAAALVLIVGASAGAQVPDAFKKCRAITDALKRLECFDAAATPPPPQKTDDQASPAGSKGKWEAQSSTSKIDDSTNAYIFLESNEPVRARSIYTPTNARLVIRCQEGKTGLYVIVGVFLGSESTGVTYRLDKAPAKKEWWSISNDHKAIGLWEGARTLPFIKGMLDKKEMVFSVTPYSESTVIVTFPIDGLAEAIKPVAAACKWPTPKDDETARKRAGAAKKAECDRLQRERNLKPDMMRAYGCE